MFPLVGIVVGALIGVVATDANWWVSRDRSAPIRPLAVFLAVSALVIGGSFGVVWSVWPPPDLSAVAARPQQFGDRGDPWTGPADDECAPTGHTLCAVIYVNADGDESREPPLRVPVDNPWLILPLLTVVGAAGAGAVVVAAGGRLVRDPPAA
ncbi:hypothetical protein [Rhodococcus oryzae]|uniref:hypothetical protein n=1 Tax=Rhodococcus oryzae TaxID=2571143 RepID=UPI003789EBE0